MKHKEAVLPYSPKVEKKQDLIRLRDDFRIFGGWYTTLKTKKKFKYTKDEILEKFLVPCLKALIAEGSTEFHSKNWKKLPREIYLEAFDKIVTKFRYLVKPHGQLIWSGTKTATVHAKKFIQGSFFSIVDPDLEYGYARFEEGKKISLEGFSAQSDQHHITEEERKEWWPDKSSLYLYKLRTWIPLEKPRAVKVPKGVQTYGNRQDLKIQESEEKRGFDDFEYLLHHIHKADGGKEKIHHCFMLDHMANMFVQEHLAIQKGKVFLNGREIKDGVFHIIHGLEKTQQIVWSDQEAQENKITPKKIRAGMTLKEKAKEW